MNLGRRGEGGRGTKLKIELYLDTLKPLPAMLKSTSATFILVVTYGVFSMPMLIGTRAEYYMLKQAVLLI